MGAKSTNVTSKQMLPLFQVISDLERPGGSNASNRTNNNANFFFENTSVLGSEDIIVHHYSCTDNLIPREFLGLDGSVSDFGNVSAVHKLPVNGSLSKKKLSKKRSKKRRRLKMDEGRDDIDYQFKGKKVVEKQRSHHKHKETETHHKPHKHSSKKHKDEQFTDGSAYSSSTKTDRKEDRRTGLFTEMGLNVYKDDDIDISRHFKNITKDDFNSETDNITIFENSDGPSYEVPRDIVARNVRRSKGNISRSDNSTRHNVIVENYEDSAGRIARVTRSKNKMSSKTIVKNYEEMLAALLAKCEQKDVQIQEKDSQILKMKTKIKDIFVCNNQFADENEFLKQQHEDMKVCIEQYKSCVTSLEDQLRRREGEHSTTSRGICGNCSANEVSAIKTGRLNSQLTEDLLMLKNVVYRLNVQLLRYQDKLRSAQPSGVHKSNVQSNIVTEKGVGIIEQANEGTTDGPKEEGLSIPSLPTFGDDSANQQDADSNADLNQKLDAEKRLNFSEERQRTYSIECEEQSAWGDVNTHTLAPLLNSYQESLVEKDQLIRDYESEFNRFTANLKQVVEENDAMHLSSTKMAAELAAYKGKSGMAIVERDSLRRENQELRDKVTHLAEKLKEVHELYEQKLEAVSRDYNLIHEEYFKCKTSLAATQSRCQTFEDQRKGLLNSIPTNVYNNTVQECKRLFEELKNRYEADKGRLSARLAVLQESNSHLESKIVDISCEKQKVENKAKTGDKLIRKCRKEVAMLRGELAATKAARDSAKRRSGHATNLCRQLAGEISKGVAGEQAQQVRAEKILVQKEALKELDAVEQRMIEQNRDLEMIKKKSATEICRLEDMLRESNATTEAMRQHINKERLIKYGGTSSGIQHVPEELTKMRLRSRNEEGARGNIPLSSSVPAKGDIFIQRVRTKMDEKVTNKN